MTDPTPRRAHTSTGLLWTVALAAVIALVIAVAAASVLLRSADDAGPTPAPSASAEAGGVRPSLHITPDQHWMNDPQRPFFAGGRWHAYYLYNADHPEGNGTAWYHVTSTDLVTWQDEGVAIDKYENGLGDIQSGSAVIDADNTAGFGAGAVIALVTQQHDGVQRQSLYYSTDDGYTFTAYEGNPVMENPGVDDFRDPKVVWDGSQWVMALAEGDKIGFYTSPDLTGWTYRSGFIRDDLGLLECPDLFQMSIDGDPSRVTWVLGTSADGAAYGRTTGYAYWTGTWDGAEFHADVDEPQWLDAGSDFYAAVTWADDRGTPEQKLATRYALGWVNNWAYARDLPTTAWQGGAQSLVRTLALGDVDGRPTLRSTPVEAVDAYAEAEVVTDASPVLAADRPLTVAATGVEPRRVRLEVSQTDLAGGRLDLVIGDEARASVTIDADAAEVSVDRSADAAASALPDTYRLARSTPFTWVDGIMTLDVFIDGMTLEVFVNGGEASLSSVVFVDSTAVALQSADGASRVEAVAVERLADAASRPSD